MAPNSIRDSQGRDCGWLSLDTCSFHRLMSSLLPYGIKLVLDWLILGDREIYWRQVLGLNKLIIRIRGSSHCVLEQKISNFKGVWTQWSWIEPTLPLLMGRQHWGLKTEIDMHIGKVRLLDKELGNSDVKYEPYKKAALLNVMYWEKRPNTQLDSSLLCRLNVLCQSQPPSGTGLPNEGKCPGLRLQAPALDRLAFWQFNLFSFSFR